ncbi:cellulose binding domain-containing protein [Paractinoplanes lichenicola]|uniref:cellulose binding domain-containing protein n=1 Tax=Paractinoplanes lichenicola TaxID=2802976 RepID=UPI0027DD208A|nr:cellulose binding domain-containing protein [Actinoplanes lichenicola]
MTLSWTASTPGSSPVAAYDVNYTQVFNDIYYHHPAGNVTSVTITSNIRPATQYRFWILARDTENRTSISPAPIDVITPASTTGDTTPPSAPANLRITAATPTGPTLAWDPATDDVAVTGYNVYFFDGWFTSTLVGTTTGTSLTAPQPTSGTGLRSYYVRAKDAAGNLSIASNQVTPPVTTTPPPPARTCQVTYKTTAEWRGGFVAEVTIANKATTPVNGWSLTVALPGDQQVTSSWNASFTQAGATVTLTDARWNARIPASGSVTVGILGRWTTSNAAPTTFALNGTPLRLTRRARPARPDPPAARSTTHPSPPAARLTTHPSPPAARSTTHPSPPAAQAAVLHLLGPRIEFEGCDEVRPVLDGLAGCSATPRSCWSPWPA